ncbi:MAG TPA: FAD-dependent oxidoreductase [Gammaproteobacteria bacterium]|jgi:glycine/D-amino acid oxidase-like deaminating enzyme|nr:FAD-dependent oxidoreductase [Gammaproteobacteria bacterium]
MNFDIVIIGNGIIGLSTAYALNLENPDINIGIIGKRNNMGAASTASGAMLGCFGEVTATSLESIHGQEKLKVAVKSTALWPEWLAKINNSSNHANKLSIKEGTFILLNSSSGMLDNKNYDAIIAALQLYYEPYQEVDPREIPGMIPCENSRPLRALYLSEGSIHSQHLITAFYDIIENNQKISFIDDTVIDFNIQSKKVFSIQTKKGDLISADRFLLAAGSYSQRLLDKIPQLKFKIPKIFFGSGSSLILNCPDHQFKHVIRSPNRAGSCGAHIVPYDENILYVGASNNIRLTPKKYPKARDIYYLLERAIEQFNQNLHKAEIIKWRVGNRPVTVDTYPLIGKTSITNLWLATGTYRDGVHTSPWYAQLLSQQMLDKAPGTDNKFLPERPPILPTTKKDSIKQFIEHYVSAGHEHAIKLPKIGWHELFEDIWKHRAENIYTQLATELGLSPDLLIMLDQEPDGIFLVKEYCDHVIKDNIYNTINPSENEIEKIYEET